MATVKKSKAKNISAGPSKKQPIAPKVDPKGQYTKVQERTLGNMKKGGKLKKAQDGKKINPSKYLEESRKRVKAVTDSARNEELRKGFDSYTDYLKSKTKPKAKDGKWMQKAAASIKRRGTEGKCTPITKPGCTGRAKALAKTFKKIAKARKGK